MTGDLASRAKGLLEDSARLHAAIAEDPAFVASVVRAAAACVDALRAGGKILVAGNGGSAAAAQHFAAEMVCRFERERAGLAAIALTADSSVMTAIGNDLGYERIFARQVEALGRPGDIFVAISTSGASPNVLAALRAARSLGITTVGLTGAEPGSMAGLCERLIRIPSRRTPLVQEAHLTVGHALCGLIEEALCRAECDTADKR